MTLQEPKSMDECVYFSNRSIGNGKAKVWVFRETCTKCNNGQMGKPKDEKTGKPKIRAKEYVCQECSHVLEKEEYEDTLTTNIKYACPHCSHNGETQVPFRWKNIQRLNEETGKKQAIKSIRFQCEKCKENIDITKKMK